MKTKKWNQNLPLLHGGDYNPDQWLDRPDILQEDIRLMQAANVNCVTLGMFSWAGLEPQEDQYEFEWLEDIIQNLYKNGIYTILATPTGALPPWLSARYPEVLQTNAERLRNLPGNRHNFCPSAPVMRDRMKCINEKLSARLGRHPGVIAWHISNEYGGNGRDASCHCPHCQEAFRNWLQKRYGTLEALNRAWWTKFWSHTYTDWKQIESPSVRGENVLHGLNLDWRRFVSDQLLDFCREEIRTVKQFSTLPVTTNMMGFFKPLNYFDWAKYLDFISWDCYPYWHSEENEYRIASEAAASHDLMRSLKGQPFLLMESTPSLINWRPFNILKRPGMHELSSLQAVAHGSEGVMYFQWRKSRGGCEKFHGAVVDHKNKENTRVFRDVKTVGERLHTLSSFELDNRNRARTALIFDWENWWAMEDAWAVQNKPDYQKLFLEYYRPLWEMGIETDIIDMQQPLDGYEVVIAPYNYLYRDGYEDRIRRYVEKGGCYVTTCWSGETDSTDLCFMDRHPLADVLGIETEEMDAPNAGWSNTVEFAGRQYAVTGLRGLVHTETAEVLGRYQKDFYAGYPALTKNRYGKGEAFYIASQNESAFLRKLYRMIFAERKIECGLSVRLPEGVTVCGRRIRGKQENGMLWFLQNYSRREETVELGICCRELETGELLEGPVLMQPFSVKLLQEV